MKNLKFKISYSDINTYDIKSIIQMTNYSPLKIINDWDDIYLGTYRVEEEFVADYIFQQNIFNKHASLMFNISTYIDYSALWQNEFQYYFYAIQDCDNQFMFFHKDIFPEINSH
jgi:antirestriction protein